MLAFEFERLSALGLTPALANRAVGLAASGDKRCELVRIALVHRGSVVVHDGVEERSARPLPRLVRTLDDERTALTVGDWVLAAVDAHGETWIETRVPPSSHIARRDSNGSVHPVVSNVDCALLVMGLDDDFSPRRLERYLALVRDDAITPVVVLTKADFATPTDADLARRLALLDGRIPAGVEVFAVNALDASRVRALDRYLGRGQTLVLLGSSGAGKSTLTNTLLGVAIQDTGPVRAHDGCGMHTTTSRSLHRLPSGACVIDTPGLRALRPDIGEAALASSFEDIDALAARCRFRDCAHEQEPGCAVRDAIGVDRLRNYHKLLREMRRDTLTALDRQRHRALWRARSRGAELRLRAKRGE
jgi:ribosome biogenesis GTPase